MESPVLQKEMSKVHLLFISFAAIFGSGWLFAPFYAAQIAGPASLVAWFLGAVISIVIGMAMAEVVVLFPRTGGLTQIARITHGEYLALSVTIFNLLVFIILPAIEVRAVLQYLSSYFKVFGGPENSISNLGYGLAFFLLGLITLVNLRGSKTTANLTQGIVIFKLITPILLCFSFLYALGVEGTFNFARFSSQPKGSGVFNISWNDVFKAIATSGIIFSFNGFNQATFFAGEAKNPQKAIPFAIIGSLLLSGSLYLLIQYVFLVSVPEASLVQGWGKLAFMGDEGPFAGIAVTLGLGWLLSVVYADAIISPLGTAFSYASAAPRIFYALAEDSVTGKRLLKINQNGISTRTILLTLVLECLVFVGLPSLKAMISLLVAAFVTCYTVAPASLLTLRRTQPNLLRPFRVRMVSFVAFLSLFFSNLMVYFCGWVALRNLASVALSLFGFYLIWNLVRGAKEKVRMQFLGSGWFVLQTLAITLLSYYDRQWTRSHPSPLSFGVVFTLLSGVSLGGLFLSQREFPKT